MSQDESRPRILIAGSGVAALEGALALRSFLEARELDIALMTNQRSFEYRPLSVLEPFDKQRTWSLPLTQLADDHDIELVDDLLGGVDVNVHVAQGWSGRPHPYDLLLVAIGAQPEQEVRGAALFRGAQDADLLRAVLVDIVERRAEKVAFVLPPGLFWTLPAYELALLSSEFLQARRLDRRVCVVTPEPRPLDAFGPHASEAITGMLDRHHVELVVDAHAMSADGRRLELADGRKLLADRVVALPSLNGRTVEGLPHDPAGFIAVDEHGRVRGCPGVYAAGDVTAFPLKHGGLACQQADAAVDAMLAEIGYPIAPRPFRPVLEGVLLSPDDPAYLLRSSEAGEDLEPRSSSLWWPPSKIAGRHLSPYLALRCGAPRTPERRPAGDIVPVTVDLGGAEAP